MSKLASLLTVAETEALLDRALADFDAMAPNDDGDRPVEATDQRVDYALKALTFACLSAGRIQAPSLLPQLSRAFDELEYADAHDWRQREALSAAAFDAIGATVRRHGGANDDVRALADDLTPRVRLAVANALDAERVEDSALLETLALDQDADVRAMAIQKLGVVRPVWWRGKFLRDPTERLTPASARRLQGTLRRLCALLDLGAKELKPRLPEIVALAAKLPAATVQDLCAALVRSGDGALTFAPLVAHALLREGGLATFARIVELCVEADNLSDLEREVESALSNAPSKTRERLVRALFDLGASYPPSEEFFDGPGVALGAGIGGWPDAHATELIDRYLALPDHTESCLGWRITSRLREISRPPVALIERAAAMRDDGYRGVADGMARALDDVLLNASRRVLRPRAERALRSDAEVDVKWGLIAMLTRCHDPKSDGTRQRFVARLCAEPRYRAVLCATHETLPYVLPYARAELREATLDLEASTAVFTAITAMFGDPRDQLAIERARPKYGKDSFEKVRRDEVRQRRERRQEFADLLGPRAQRTPLTPEERAGMVAIYARSEIKGIDWLLVRWSWSTTGIVPTERALADRLIAASRAREEFTDRAMANLLWQQPDAALIPVARELHDAATASLERYSRWQAYVGLHAALGLPPPAKPDDAAIDDAIDDDPDDDDPFEAAPDSAAADDWADDDA